MDPTPPPSHDFGRKYEELNFITRRVVDHFFSTAADSIRSLGAASVLEVGCGEGYSTARLRELLGPEVKLEASDVDRHNVGLARARNPGVSIVEESVYALNRQPRSHDLIVCMEVLEHLEHPDQAMRELVRVSRRWILLTVPREPIWRALNMARGRYVRRLGNFPGHLQHWSTRSFCTFVGAHAHVREVRTPLPWTQILAEVRD